MQTVWSRVAQSGCYCNCSSCVSATNSLARRVTTSTSRRRTRVGNAFTVFSSSLAVAATFVDSKRKDARSDHWDRVISKARADVAEIDHEQERRLESLSRRAEQADLGNKSIGSPCLYPPHPQIRYYDKTPQWFTFPDLRSGNWAQVFEWATQQDQLRAASGFQEFKGIPLSLLQELSVNQIEQLINDEGTLRRFFYWASDSATMRDEPPKLLFSSKSLKILEWTTAMMVWQMLSHCSESSTAMVRQLLDRAPQSRNVEFREILLKGPTEPGIPARWSFLSQPPNQDLTSAEDPVSKFVLEKNYIRDMIARAKSRLNSLSQMDKNDERLFENFESPRLPWYGRRPNKRLRHEAGLNQRLTLLLSEMEDGKDPSPMLSDICYDLLMSPTPPTIKTYNLLLVRFCQLRHESLVQVLWESMCESHVRPNETTYSTLLRFFTATNNEIEFRKLVRRMKGYDRGVALMKQDVVIKPISAQRVRRLRYDGHHSDLVFEKARMNQEVYESLIIGALKFMGEQSAMHYYKNMISEGWETTSEILNAILEDCCNRVDWEGACSVWQQIFNIAGKASEQAYEWMLRLCQECDRYYEAYQVLQEGALQGVLPLRMLDLLRHFERGKYYLSAEGAKRLMEGSWTREISKTPKWRTTTDVTDDREKERVLSIKDKRKEFSRVAMQIEQHLPRNIDSGLNNAIREPPAVRAVADERWHHLETTTTAPKLDELSEDIAKADLSTFLDSFNSEEEVLQMLRHDRNIKKQSSQEGSLKTPNPGLWGVDGGNDAPRALGASA